MDKLIKVIERIRANIEGLRKHSLKETSTRKILIDPVLEALGWDLCDPDEVELERPTVDGKSVDYALKINRHPRLLVEAKPLDDPLKNVKDITQVVGYAANDGITWCALTNGVRWQVYRSIERCPAPDKLMFEVSIDPRDSEGLSVEQIAEQLWRLSRDETAKGTLDAIGEQTFTDSKVRKALDEIMIDAPLPLVRVVRSVMGEASPAPQKVKESVARIWTGRNAAATLSPASCEPGKIIHRSAAQGGERLARGPRQPKTEYDEDHHIRGRTQEALELYRAIDRLCLSLNPGEIAKRYLAKSVSYSCGRHIFCSLHLLKSGLRVWLDLKYSRLENPPIYARDVCNVGHWGSGDLELAVTSLPQLEEAGPLIRQSFDAASR